MGEGIARIFTGPGEQQPAATPTPEHRVIMTAEADADANSHELCARTSENHRTNKND